MAGLVRDMSMGSFLWTIPIEPATAEQLESGSRVFSGPFIHNRKKLQFLMMIEKPCDRPKLGVFLFNCSSYTRHLKFQLRVRGSLEDCRVKLGPKQGWGGCNFIGLEEVKEEELVVELNISYIEQEEIVIPAVISMEERINSIVEVVKTEVGAVKEDVNNVTKEVKEELKTEVNLLKSDMTRIKDNTTIVKTDLGDVKTDIVQLKADMANMKTDMDQLTANMAKLMRSMRLVKAAVKERQWAPVEGWECSVCSTSPSGAVYQCSAGHLLCSSCLATVERCAVCRATLPDPPCRNLTAEGCIARAGEID